MSFTSALQMMLILATILVFLIAMIFMVPFLPTFLGTVTSFILTCYIR